MMSVVSVANQKTPLNHMIESRIVKTVVNVNVKYEEISLKVRENLL